jgi:ribonuclease BN (tRNA processing enzyme)
LRGADLLILDAQYTDEEYQRHIGWGHGSISSVVSLAADADAKRLVLFHHDPNHDDETVDKIVDKARMQIAQLGKSIAVEGAREGSELILS